MEEKCWRWVPPMRVFHTLNLWIYTSNFEAFGRHQEVCRDYGVSLLSHRVYGITYNGQIYKEKTKHLEVIRPRSNDHFQIHRQCCHSSHQSFQMFQFLRLAQNASLFSLALCTSDKKEDHLSNSGQQKRLFSYASSSTLYSRSVTGSVVVCELV